MNIQRIVLAGLMAIAAVKPSLSQSTDATAPPHRRHHALTYDPASKRVLLHGGQHLVSNSEAPMLNDLWSWDGARWTQLSASVGMGMIAHKLFADGDGGVFITANAPGLTARWDGQRWVTLNADATTRREMAAGAYDPRRKRFVLFGGHVGGRAFPDDTWEFDGQRWTRAATTGPTPRLGGGMAFDARRQVMVLFGGIDSAGHKLGDTWEWNGARWSKVSSTGPSPRFGAGIAYDARRNEIVVFGGADSANHKLNDTWRWNGDTWRRAETAAVPSPRSEGYLAYDDARGVIVMFGGEAEQTIPTLGDTWEWNGTQWTQVLGPQDNRRGRLTYGPHDVGFRAVCDTAGRQTPAREQLLIWYPATRRASSAPMPFSEYLAPSRELECGGRAATDEQRQSAIAAFAQRIANAAGAPNEREPVGGRLFPNDSAPSIARKLSSTMTRAYPTAEPVRGAFPIVVFAFGGAIEESVLIESLASHGYVVATFPHSGIPPGSIAREGAGSGPMRDLTLAREIGRAADAAVRFGQVDGSRIAVVANGGFIPGAIWLQAQTGRLSSLVTVEGRVPGATPLASAPPGTPQPSKRVTDDSLLRSLPQTWRAPVLDWQVAGNLYTRGVLESFSAAERIRVDAQVNHANSSGLRRVVYPGDTIASTANDALGLYVQQFFALTLQHRADASAFFDRTPEANGVLTGLLEVRRVRASTVR